MNISALEQEKYRSIWALQDYSSKTASSFHLGIIFIISDGDSVLDVGCGDGRVAANLIDAGVDAYGLDITINQAVPNLGLCRLTEAPIWDIPLKDNSIDWVVSCDVLEHLPPEMVDAAISEMQRVARKGQIHIIATFDDRKYNGYDVHLSVHPIEWWRERFDAGRLHIIERSK